MFAGDCVVFDNQRVLHGRNGFEITPADNGAEESQRHYQGGYVDWDEIKSRINVLKRRLGESE